MLFSVSLMLHFTHNLEKTIDKRKMIGLVKLFYYFFSPLKAVELDFFFLPSTRESSDVISQHK